MRKLLERSMAHLEFRGHQWKGIHWALILHNIFETEDSKKAVL
jgi:hypothetical protein